MQNLCLCFMDVFSGATAAERTYICSTLLRLDRRLLRRHLRYLWQLKALFSGASSGPMLVQVVALEDALTFLVNHTICLILLLLYSLVHVVFFGDIVLDLHETSVCFDAGVWIDRPAACWVRLVLFWNDWAIFILLVHDLQVNWLFCSNVPSVHLRSHSHLPLLIVHS